MGKQHKVKTKLKNLKFHITYLILFHDDDSEEKK